MTPPTGWSAEQLIGNITTGYAITYIFGLVGLILIIKLLPALLGVVLDLAATAFRNHAGCSFSLRFASSIEGP